MTTLLFDKDKDEWKELTPGERENLSDEDKEKVLYLDGKLKEKLDYGIKQQKNKNDCVGIISGDEGSGKSALAGNIMRYVTKDKFNGRQRMIGSDYEEGIDKIKNIKQSDAIMFDEGNVFFLSTEIVKKEQKELHKVFSIFRQKFLFVLIVLPSFFRLSSYFALDRSKFLLRTYTKKGERGYFEYYGEKTKEKLYRKGKKEHNYNVSHPRFRGRFTKCKVLESEEYKKFKLKTLYNSITTAKKKKQKTEYQIKQEFQRKIIRNNPNKTNVELGEVLGISHQAVSQIKNKMKEEQETQT